MRNELKNIGNETRNIYTATFKRFGTKSGYMGLVETVLLTDIKDTEGNIITDHLWFNKTK